MSITATQNNNRDSDTNDSGQVIDNSTTTEQDIAWQSPENRTPVHELKENTHAGAQAIEQTTPKHRNILYKPQLQPHEIELFTSYLAKGYSPVKALRQASERFSDKSFGYVWKVARQQLNESDIQRQVETKKEKLSELARLSEERIEEILTDGKVGKTLADVSMFIFDHANGKATQRTEITSKSVSVNIDLTAPTQAPQ
jgi:hypothetical protein